MFIVKIFDNDLDGDFDIIYEAFNYIYNFIDCKIIHLSCGISYCENIVKFKDIIDKLALKGVIIISSFDNDGVLSYPACFINTIGVDINNDYLNENDFDYIEGDIVDIRATSKAYRTKWLSDKAIILKGSSFSSTYITKLVYEITSSSNLDMSISEVKKALKKMAKTTYKTPFKNNINKIEKLLLEIDNAIIFPFNKEMHSLMSFSELTKINVIGIYDIKYSKVFNSKIKQLIPYTDSEICIKDYADIDWGDDFDTLILGHCGEINRLTKSNIFNYMITKAIENNKLFIH